MLKHGVVLFFLILKCFPIYNFDLIQFFNFDRSCQNAVLHCVIKCCLTLLVLYTISKSNLLLPFILLHCFFQIEEYELNDGWGWSFLLLQIPQQILNRRDLLEKWDNSQFYGSLSFGLSASFFNEDITSSADICDFTKWEWMRCWWGLVLKTSTCPTL